MTKSVTFLHSREMGPYTVTYEDGNYLANHEGVGIFSYPTLRWLLESMDVLPTPEEYAILWDLQTSKRMAYSLWDLQTST